MLCNFCQAKRLQQFKSLFKRRSNIHRCLVENLRLRSYLHFFAMSFFIDRMKFRKATIRPKRQFVPSDNSSQATIRPKRQFVPSDNSSQATIRPKRQFVQATIRPKRQFVPNSKKRQFDPSDNSSHFEKATIRPNY